MILMYHSVATSEAAGWIDPSNHVAPCRFAQQLEFLARSRHVISLSALVEHLKRDTPLAPGTVVLTFDDGYLDNLTVAAPLLARWRLPATLFLTTAYIARGAPQWIDSLYSAFRARTRHQLVLSGSSPVVWQLQSPRSRLEAYRALADRLLVADAQRRAQLLAEVWEQLRPAAAPPRLTLTWGDVRTLRRDYPLWDFGVHTAEHLDLSTHVGPAARADLDRSRAEVGQELGTPPQHFSYPYSRATAEARRLVVECGFRSAVLWDRPELVRHGADPHALPRTQPPRSLGLFRFVTSGAYPDLPRALFGRPR